MKTIFKLILSLSLIICTSALFAQVNGGVGMQTNNNSKKSGSANQNIGEEMLPNWVFETQGEGRYVGVSDPNLNVEEAFNQALLRAWMLSQIDNQMGIQSHSISEDGTNWRSFELTSVAISALLHDVALYVGREYKSKYGEYFVEFFTKSTSSHNDKMYRFSTDADRCEFKFTQCTQYNNSKSSISVNGAIGYSIYGTDLFAKTLAYSNDKEGHDINQNKGVGSQLRYKEALSSKLNSNQEDKTLLNSDWGVITPEPLGEGYWSAFISSLLCEATKYSECCFVQTSMSFGENYSISKSTSNNIIRMSMSETQIIDNKLYGQWKIEVVELPK